MKCFAFLLRVLMRRLILIQLVASGEVIYGNRLNTPHLISPPHWPLKKQKKKFGLSTLFYCRNIRVLCVGGSVPSVDIKGSV